jgi:phage shock protein A
MGLFDRMSRAASANFNAILAKLEDPKKEIELIVSEMEDALRAAKRTIVETVASEKQERKRAEELAQETLKWEKRAELAVQQGEDDLAREALRHKRRLASDRERAERLGDEVRAEALAQRSELERMERTIDEVKAKKGLLRARVAASKAGGEVKGLGAAPGSDAFGDFRRMEAKVEDTENRVRADEEVRTALARERGPTGLSPAEIEAKFRALEAAASQAPSAVKDDVDDELKTLKTRFRVKP